LIVLVGVPAAHACNRPDITVQDKAVGPGDWVDFSISGTDPGASYKLFAYGEEVLSGSDADGGGLTGRFQMPDLGQSSLLAAVEVSITHPNPGSAGGDYHGGAPWWGSTREVYYRAVPPPHAKTAPAERAKPKPKPKPKRARAPAAEQKKSPVSGARRKGRARAPQRSTGKRRARERGADEGHERRGRQRAQEEPRTVTMVRPSYPGRPTAAAPVVPREGAGIKGAAMVIALLTIGCAVYGGVSARRRRVI
jgi:hypothetical protein